MPSDLSGGMQKRVALARSMVLEPQTLLYDEPTSGLDPVTGRLVSSLIRDTANQNQITSVVVTHDIQAAKMIADRIVLLASGKVAFCGTPDEAQSSSNPEIREFLDAYRSPSEDGIARHRSDVQTGRSEPS